MLFANSESTIKRVAWKQQPIPTNYVTCGQVTCYSNCYIDDQIDISLNSECHFRYLCNKYNHCFLDHHRSNAKWEQVDDTQ